MTGQNIVTDLRLQNLETLTDPTQLRTWTISMKDTYASKVPSYIVDMAGHTQHGTQVRNKTYPTTGSQPHSLPDTGSPLIDGGA